jgi:hypothetical protein
MTNEAKAIAAVAAQIGSTLLADNAQWHHRFQVKSKTSSSLYTIAQRCSDDTWGCSCPGWRHHRQCKHLTDVLSRLAGVASTNARDYDQMTQNVLSSARRAYLDLDLGPAKKVATPAIAGRVVDLGE